MTEEEGGRTSQKRRLYDPSITAEWASVQPDLVQLIADCLLSTSGVDEYMAMRAVCPSWRCAVAKPSPHAAVADLRFRPRQWVLLHGADDDQGRPLFLNVTTGRFRRLRHPVLHDYIFVGASDGLLVLGDREPPHAARLLNPLTGDMLHFVAPIPPEAWVETAVAGTEPTIIFSFTPALGEYLDFPAYYSLQEAGEAVYSADPTGQLRAVKFHDGAYNEENFLHVQSMVTYAGNVYMLTTGGVLCKIFWTCDHWYAERMLEININHNGGLVVSAGKLLLVREDLDITEVFIVDVKRKALESIESIGSSVLFLHYGRCMVVDADKLPSIKRNCIYSTFSTNRAYSTYVTYNLSDGKIEDISGPQVHRHGHVTHEGPLSLAQVFLTPCPAVKAQLDRIHPT